MRKSTIRRFLGTFSTFSIPKDFDQPLGQNQIGKLIGHIHRAESVQASPSTATMELWVADFAGVLGDAYVVSSIQPGVGETMTFDLQKSTNGGSSFTTVLSGVFTLGSTNWQQAQLSFKSLITTSSFNAGDVFQVIRTYTAGGSAAPITYTKVAIEPSLKDFILSGL